ncbi:RraA family protein [Tuwongella immobilis]|uniref:Putative 4-hydroxy-4-methyl-2-oxoglutarate aldolase n=1 Tax=Tuwongella immobilis TaxID=692036 RepID=A0A6C2YTK4_9BACT|nr:RraA family protein [Tuwongella immobilis]VIP05040.1 demethylmenaquinone methyltransferase : Demethylmenaquinone methyltransferase OS=uncultured planctomycete GN=HGMM_F48A06C22 PE=4 SV=1: Methyltransf_6 [Tuwongella immobilis]VTS07436.1 demethylmenaquinone methyltransferase : Demethylmenaquinone methyltransferase OS=uncultured planctomycete GN=HGMM_F48A06C22 PE=4 SV=1: Methyltransf_6 [Tuwongella immobilis]
MPNYPIVSAAVLEKLRRYDTPTVCNVIELFGIRPRTSGYLDGRILPAYPKLPPMVGYASTATFRAGSPPRSGDVYAGLSTQVQLLADSPGPTIVVFQDLDDPAVAATFGEVMCTTYQAFGAVGLITSGAGRDLDQVEALNFPVFTNGTICSHGDCQIVQLDIPVRVGGITIYPGDLLHGDRNGVTTIPTEIAEAVADACGELMAAEQIVLDYLKSGSVTPAGYDDARKQCHARMQDLAQKCRASLENSLK